MNKKQAQKLLAEWLTEDLPSITKQKRFVYRPTIKEVKYTWRVLNTVFFNDQLKMPNLILGTGTRKWWALCSTDTYVPKVLKTKSNCNIILSTKWYCKQWFIDTLAHEMVHQYQWDIDGPERVAENKEPLMSHGPSFYKHKNKFKCYTQLNLKVCHSTAKWFKYQKLSKC
jgi:hypothetical protein|tara:strand:- start:14 stop:523 length:510 start_codon:yes stop_codon:yes gene_type:complete